MTVARPRATGRSSQRRSLKMVVTGPFDAGKTTLIQSISEIPVLSTERSVSDNGYDSAVSSRATTVAMDFGRLSIGEDLALHLFGTPGQRRFDFMWEILADGMLGFVVMVDGSDEASIAGTKETLEFFTGAAQVPYIVAVNKVAEDDEGAITTVRDALGVADEIRVVACDARDRESVKTVLVELLLTVLEQVSEETDTDTSHAVPANA